MNYDKYGTVKRVETVEFPQESLWDISSVLPEQAEFIRSRWDKADMVDFGAKTYALPWQRVYKKGKGFFVRMMEECVGKFNVDELWSRMEQTAKDESVFF